MIAAPPVIGESFTLHSTLTIGGAPLNVTSGAILFCWNDPNGKRGSFAGTVISGPAGTVGYAGSPTDLLIPGTWSMWVQAVVGGLTYKTRSTRVKVYAEGEAVL
jgi:hypothetical protein